MENENEKRGRWQKREEREQTRSSRAHDREEGELRGRWM
jgi:hypothetical protein